MDMVKYFFFIYPYFQYFHCFQTIIKIKKILVIYNLILGEEVWEDSSKYSGKYKKGKKNGIGSYSWSNGSTYQGEWKQNFLHGYGIYNFSDKRLYYGQLYKNSINGIGHFKWPEGKKYWGNFKNDKRDGFGIFLWTKPITKCYIGFWKDGKQEGIGKNITNIKTKISIWKKGKAIKYLNDFHEGLSFFIGENKNFLHYFYYDLQKVEELLKN